MTDTTELKLMVAPIGWITDDHLTDKSATTYDKAVADRWCEKGWPVQALYDGAAVLALIAENEALTARINDMHADRVEAVAEIVVQGLEIDQLTTENEALRRAMHELANHPKLTASQADILRAAMGKGV